jgi:uncharacterized protein involved in type VI secretion and phage assembly
MTAVGLIAPAVTVDGSPLGGQALNSLVSLRVQRGFCVVGRATLRFVDDGFVLSASRTFELGAEVAVSAPGKGELFRGTVTGVSLDQSVSAVPEFVVVADDQAYRLTRGMSPQSFLQMTYADVLRKTISAAGVAVKINATAALSEQYEYLLQTGTTMAFLDRIAQRTGTVWWVDGRELRIEPGDVADGAAQVALGADLVEFSLRASGLRPTAVTVSGWDRDRQQKVTSTSRVSSSTASPPAFVGAYSGRNPAGKLGEAAAALADCRPASTKDAELLAGAVYDAEAAGAVVARGTAFVNPDIKPAATVTVADAGPASGQYVVTEVEHAYTRRGFTTHFVAGPRRPTGLVDTLAAPVADPGLEIGSLIIGVVTNNRDPESAGRVKVKFAAMSGEVESDWARVVSVGAGGKRGLVFQPEVNDEVLLGFEFGDTRRPVVIGGLFSKVNQLPTADKLTDGQGNVDYRRITSRLNHVIELADGDTRHILLQLGTRPHKLRLAEEELVLEVGAGVPVTIKAGNSSIAFAESGAISVQAQQIEIKATEELKLHGAKVTVEADVQAEVKGNFVQIKGQAGGTVDGGGTLALKGGQVMVN